MGNTKDLLGFYIKAVFLLAVGYVGFYLLFKSNFLFFYLLYAFSVFIFTYIQHLSKKKTRNLIILFVASIILNPYSLLGLLNYIGVLTGNISGDVNYTPLVGGIASIAIIAIFAVML